MQNKRLKNLSIDNDPSSAATVGQITIKLEEYQHTILIPLISSTVDKNTKLQSIFSDFQDLKKKAESVIKDLSVSEYFRHGIDQYTKSVLPGIIDKKISNFKSSTLDPLINDKIKSEEQKMNALVHKVIAPLQQKLNEVSDKIESIPI